MTPKATPPDTGLVEVGQPAPDFDLEDQTQKRHQLSQLRGKWVILYFYPKDSTPGCTLEACRFRDRLDDLQSADAVVLGVSPDSPASHAKFAARHDLTFHLLSDPGAKICTAYGVWQTKSMMGRKYMGVVRTTYLIDPKGVVAHRWDRVKVLGHDKAVVHQLKLLQSSNLE